MKFISTTVAFAILALANAVSATTVMTEDPEHRTLMRGGGRGGGGGGGGGGNGRNKRPPAPEEPTTCTEDCLAVADRLLENRGIVANCDQLICAAAVEDETSCQDGFEIRRITNCSITGSCTVEAFFCNAV